VALLPLLAALWSLPKDAQKWKAPLLGFTSGLVFFTATFSWLSELADLFESPALFGLPLLLAAYLALYPALWSWLVTYPPRPGKTNAASSLANINFAVRATCAWVALDWLRGWLFTGFGWNSPGVALHNNLALVQIADLFGVHGVTFVVVFTNMILALVVRRIAQTASIRTLPNLRAEIMTALLLVGLSVSYGVRCVVQKNVGPTIPLRTIAIQPNIAQEEKFDESEENAVLKKIETLMLVAAAIQPAPDLFLWPEAATPRGMFADEANHDFTLRQAALAKAPLLLGTLEPVPTGPDGTGEMYEYNSAVLINGPEKPLQSYRKRHIVPFGEFLPFRDWLPRWVRMLVPGDLEAGKEANLLFLEKPAVRIGALVCFEDSLARETRALVLAGAQVLVNLTNDSWFGGSAAAAQHLANAKFRAIETRLPLIRCANTGETCSVDALGRVEQRLAAFTEGVDTVAVRVAEHPVQTTYTRFGDLWIAGCGLAALVLARQKRL
jgi:apolipoprotein N-acyltransferase